MEMLENRALTRTEFDIVDALLEHFDPDKKISGAISFSAMASAARVRFVHEIVKIGADNGFRLRGELYALAEACLMVGPRELLAEAVLAHPRLTPMEKVSVMLNLCQQCGAVSGGAGWWATISRTL